MKKLYLSTLTVGILALGLAFSGSTAISAVGQAPVNLLSAGNFVILSETGVTNVPTSAITGNIGTSPITGALREA